MTRTIVGTQARILLDGLDLMRPTDYDSFVEEVLLLGDSAPRVQSILCREEPAPPSPPDMSTRQQRRWAQRKGTRK